MQRCEAVTAEVLLAVFETLRGQGVVLEAMVLKPNMVLPGLNCPQQDSAEIVAIATVRCPLRTVPAAVAGVGFLSGGQTGELASARLNAMNTKTMKTGDGSRPWPLVFSFARAIQQPALEIWGGQEANVAAAQHALHHRAQCNHAALRGEYSPAMEAASTAQAA